MGLLVRASHKAVDAMGRPNTMARRGRRPSNDRTYVVCCQVGGFETTLKFTTGQVSAKNESPGRVSPISVSGSSPRYQGSTSPSCTTLQLQNSLRLSPSFPSCWQDAGHGRFRRAILSKVPMGACFTKVSAAGEMKKIGGSTVYNKGAKYSLEYV